MNFDQDIGSSGGRQRDVKYVQFAALPPMLHDRKGAVPAEIRDVAGGPACASLLAGC
jgi:hypothetical protein